MKLRYTDTGDAHSLTPPQHERALATAMACLAADGLRCPGQNQASQLGTVTARSG
jgi:hypothetical protein